jgi:hypothetical protein
MDRRLADPLTPVTAMNTKRDAGHLTKVIA